MNLHEFRIARDQIALASMSARLAVLEIECKALAQEYNRLRELYLECTDRKQKESLEFALYDQPTGEYGSVGGVAWQYAVTDSRIDDILRDSRYQAHVAAQRNIA